MAKRNNCCRICGRLDYDDDGGEYLICRVCGEKRLKRRMPWKETCLSILFMFLGFFFLFLSYSIYTYKAANSFFAILISPFDGYNNYVGSFNWIEAFLDRLQLNGDLVYIEWFFKLLSLISFILFGIFVKKMNDASKKIIV